MRSFVIAVTRCARCGADHRAVRFMRFRRKCQKADAWGICPSTGEPILMVMDTDNPPLKLKNKAGKVTTLVYMPKPKDSTA
jgi:hypothetical protein